MHAQKNAYVDAVSKHLSRSFDGHEMKVAPRALGRADQEFPGLRVFEIAPGPKFGLWVYASAGFGEGHASTGHREFILVGPRKAPWLAQIVAMLGPYHTERGLDIGHTVPLGEPWLPESSMDHLLLSAPYPFGSSLEWVEWGDLSVQFMWVLPIHDVERDFKVEHGQEALEQRFEDARIQYWDPLREPVC